MEPRHLLGALLAFTISIVYLESATTMSRPILVVLWFDTEDYILIDSDDSLLRICRFLNREGIRASFKIVGEKARVLERRHRKDIFKALKPHEIGYHTDFHSVHPTPAAYLAPLGWDDGVAEFKRRERQGFVDVQRILGRTPTWYGQPGSSWAPQAYGALRSWGIPVYLDAGTHIDLNGEPFWYCGILTLYSLRHTIRSELDGPSAVAKALAEFREAQQYLADRGGGLISIPYHPCEFAHRQFWDAINFARGANPPRFDWQVPPRKSQAEKDIAHESFESYIRAIKKTEGVRFVTAGDVLVLYRDSAVDHIFTKEELLLLAEHVASDGVTYQILNDMAISPAELFCILARFAGDYLRGTEIAPVTIPKPSPLGPVRSSHQPGIVRTRFVQFLSSLDDVNNFLETRNRLPDTVWLGSAPVSPGSFLMALADLLVQQSGNPEPPERVTMLPVDLPLRKHVRNDKKIWNWVIFPENFEAPEMMELARRQTWTLKPALPTWLTSDD